MIKCSLFRHHVCTSQRRFITTLQPPTHTTALHLARRVSTHDKGEAWKMKTAKEIAKEQAKAEKHEKFLEKKKRQEQAAAAAPPPPTAKDKKVKKPAAVDAYDPKKVEEGRYEWWEQHGYFKPQFSPEGDLKTEGKFVISIPPPNVTGSLHMGHALMLALQDTMIRRARMMGKTTAWIPGCDHAGISTQR